MIESPDTREIREARDHTARSWSNHVYGCPPCSSARSQRRPGLACQTGRTLRKQLVALEGDLRAAVAADAAVPANQGALFTPGEG